MIGLILFAHGARDPRWREPFDRLKEIVARGHEGPVTVAFLEQMEPTLSEAALQLGSAGAHRIVVVPLFLGTGGHLRRDLPTILDEAQAAAGIPISAVGAAGEDERVLQALARYCLAAGR